MGSFVQCEFHCGDPIDLLEVLPTGYVPGHHRCLTYWFSLRQLRILISEAPLVGLRGGSWAAPGWVPEFLAAWDKSMQYDGRLVEALLLAFGDAQARALLMDDPRAAISVLSVLREDGGL
jgi:hypothetical protein